MLRAFIHLIVGSLFLTCLLTPFVCELIIFLNGELPWPFSRVFDRVAMLSVLIFLLINKKNFSLLLVKDYLKRHNVAERFKFIMIGLALSIGSSALIYWFLLENGIVEISLKDSSYYFRKIPVVIIGAALISLIEEGFFRITCYQAAKEKLGAFTAAFLVSLLYASVHFISPLKSFHYLQGELLAGFIYLSAVLGSVFRAELFPAFTGLFIVGLMLCLALERSKSIYTCLGMHAGWVLVLKLIGYTSQVHITYDSALARRYVLVSYPITWLALSFVALLILVIFRQKAVETTKL